MKKWLQRGLVSLTVCAATFALKAFGTYDDLNSALFDARLSVAPRAVSGDVVFIGIDAASLNAIGSWPWSRAVHADLLDSLSDAGVREVFFDIDFAFPSDAEGDRRFAEALERAGLVYLPVFEQRADLESRGAISNRPLELFRDRSWPVFVNVFTDARSLVRMYPYGEEIDGVYIPSAASQIAGIATTRQDRFHINFSFDPQLFPAFSAQDILSGSVPQEDLAGRSIIVGAAAIELGDLHAVPVHGIIPGALIHALASETLAAGLVPAEVSLMYPLSFLFLVLVLLQERLAQSPARFIATGAVFVFSLETVSLALAVTQALSVPTGGLYPSLLVFMLWTLARRIVSGDWAVFRERLASENANRLLTHFFEDSSDAIVILDEDGRAILFSDSAKRLFGVHENNTLNFPERMRSEALKSLNEDSEITSGTLFKAKIRLGSELHHLEYIVTPSRTLHAEDNAAAARKVVSVTVRDVTQIKEQEREIAYLSNFDMLTGAMRRQAFLSQFDLRLQRDASCVLFVLNLSRFKPINALMGRALGDRVLAQVVERLENSELGLSAVGRLGGDTFAVFTETDVTDEEAVGLADAVCEIISEPYMIDSHRAKVGVHIGYVICANCNDGDAADLLLLGESALDTARMGDSPGPQLYDPAIARQQLRALEIERELEHAIEADELSLVYQPQHRVSDGELLGAEVLVRWKSAKLGVVRPDEFIPIAESAGSILHLGSWVLRRALEDAARLPPEVSIAVNVSSMQLTHGDLRTSLETALDETGVGAERICLELTETALTASPKQIANLMHEVTATGATWALDDFGTGYSSLALLAELPVEKLKFDKSFASSLGSAGTVSTLLRSVAGFCKELGITSLCEGIESDRQLRALGEIGCDEVQGYYFSGPLTLDEMIAYSGGSGGKPAVISGA